MTRPADRALRVALAGLACIVAWECATNVPESAIIVGTLRTLWGVLAQWCLTRYYE